MTVVISYGQTTPRNSLQTISNNDLEHKHQTIEK